MLKTLFAAGILRFQKWLMCIVWTFKLNIVINILATFRKIGHFFQNFWSPET
jgi:hypothetical protein